MKNIDWIFYPSKHGFLIYILLLISVSANFANASGILENYSLESGIDLTTHFAVSRHSTDITVYPGDRQLFTSAWTTFYPWVELDGGDKYPWRFNLEVSINSGFSSSLSSLANNNDLRWNRGQWPLWGDVKTVLSGKQSNYGSLELGRLDFSIHAGGWELMAGRMPVGLGTSRFVSLLDIIAPPETTSIDRSRRTGVDAFRARRTMFGYGEGEIIAAGSNPLNKGALLGRARIVTELTDYVLLAGKFRGRGLTGLGWDHSAGNRTFWGEITSYRSTVNSFGITDYYGKRAFNIISGIEWWGKNNSRTGIALYHSSQGAQNSSALMNVMSSRSYLDGSLPLAGKTVLMLNSSSEPDPLTSLSVSALLNLQDFSSLVQPQISRSLDDDSSITFYGTLATGAGPDSTASSSTSITSLNTSFRAGSEFGLLPSSIGVIYKKSF